MSETRENTQRPQAINAHSTDDAAQIRLPRIELTTFNGAFDKWLSFYNHFISMVHENSGLSEIQKLYYLKNCLKKEAEEMISSLELTGENYEVALQLLKDRYDNKRVIIQKHVRTLMDLPTLGKESAPELRKFIDSINTHLRALKSLGEPTNHWDTLLIHSFTAKLDRAAHQEWEKTITGTNMLTMRGFSAFLEKRCHILQVTNINLANKSPVPVAKPSSFKKQVCALAQSSNSCLICKGTHRIYTCENFKKLRIKERADKT